MKSPLLSLTLSIGVLLDGEPVREPAQARPGPTSPTSPAGAIRLGMSTTLAGPSADLGTSMKRGVEAGLALANANGGIDGRPIELIALDDGYEPRRAAPNMRRLIDEEGVVAIIGNVGTPTAVAALPIVLDRRVLFFAPFTGAGVLRRVPPDRYVINYRASYAEETSEMIHNLVDEAGLRPDEIAFFTQRDAYGDAGFAGGAAALMDHGVADAAEIHHVRYERNTVSVELSLAELLLADPLPRAVVMVGTYTPCAKFIKLAREAGLHALFLNVSFVGSRSLAKELGAGQDGVIVTQVVPHPGESDAPVVAEYRAALKSVEPDATPEFISLEGFVAAKIIVRALASIEGEVDRESVVDALEGLGDFDIGLGAPLRLSAEQHQASHAVWPTILERGEFIPFDWRRIREVVPHD